MSKLRKIVYLSDAQYETLLNNGSITSNGQTVVYSSDDLYITPSSSGSGGTFYAVCNSAFSVSAKVAILTNPDGFELHEGTMVVVKFAAIAPVGQITLQIAKDDNGVTTNLTNAYPLKMYGTTDIEGGAEPMAISGWAAGAVVPFIFDGTNWIRFYWNNTTYSSETAAQNGTTNSLVTTGEKYTWNNKVDRAGDTMTGSLTLSSGNISISNGSLLAGSSTRTTETQISASSIAGQIYLYAASSDGGNRGIYVPAHGTGTAKSVVTVDTNNVVSLDGNAATATKLATARTISLTGSVTGSGSFDGSGNLSITTTTNHNHDTSYVLKAGDTMTGNLTVSKATDPEVIVSDTTNTGLKAAIIVGSGHQNHGLYSYGYAPTASTFTSSTKWILYRGSDGEAHSQLKIYGAVWNDYAEYRKDNIKESQLQKPGRCVRENGDGTLTLTTKRLERGCEIISDTFGFAIGQDEEKGYNTPIASNGRVLAYPFEDIEMFKNHIGWPVCSGPNGTVSIMTEREEMEYPSRIIGTISEIPNYEEWGTGKIKVNGRIWIRIK